MTRTIEHITMKVVTESVSETDLKNIHAWLGAQAKDFDLHWLLAHADDGVIWGEFNNGKLRLDTSYAPKLRYETLQTARAFGDNAEIMLWRDGDGLFHKRSIQDGRGKECSKFDESYMLWGTHSEALENGFALMSDGSQGLRHAVPLPITLDKSVEEKDRPLRLKIRHYLEANEVTGFVRVTMSRLVELKTEK